MVTVLTVLRNLENFDCYEGDVLTVLIVLRGGGSTVVSTALTICFFLTVFVF